MLTLIRAKKDTIDTTGTIGKIHLEDKTLISMEQPWNDNIPYQSCVPPGMYELIPWESTRYSSCFVIVNEKLNVFFSKVSPNRPENGRFKCIFFHRGSYVRNFKGCSGLGETYKPEFDMITNTTQTCRIMNNHIKEKGIRLLQIIQE